MKTRTSSVKSGESGTCIDLSISPPTLSDINQGSSATDLLLKVLGKLPNIDQTWTMKSLNEGHMVNGVRKYVDWRFLYGERPLKNGKIDPISQNNCLYVYSQRQCGMVCTLNARANQASLYHSIQTGKKYLSTSLIRGYLY